MPITDRLMATGSWSLDLVDDAPEAIRRACAVYWSQVYFTPTHDTGNAMSLATLRATAFYAGVVFRRRKGRRSFGGPGLLGFLVTGQGGMIANTSTAAPLTFAQLLADLFGSAYNTGLSVGTAHSATATTVHDVTTTNASAVNTYGYPQAKPMLDLWAKQTGNEYRVLPTGAIDYGASTSLFNSTPTVLVSPTLSGREGTYRALAVDAGAWEVAGDIDNFRNYGFVFDRTNTIHSAFVGPSDPRAVYGATFNNPASPVNMVNSDQQADSNAAADLSTQAQAAADLYSVETQAISANVNEFCLWRFAVPGDWVDVYSLGDDIVDRTNASPFQGEIIYPKKMRLMGFTAPVMQGMGIYVVDGTYGGSQAITDITDYVKWEYGSTSLELDSLPARTTDIGRVSRIR